MIVKINGRYRGRPPRIGVALSGGGLRGLAHIGVLKEIDKNHIPVHMIAGTSAGAVIAGLYSTGKNSTEMTELAQRVNIHELIDAKFSVHHLIKYGMKWLFTGKFRLLSVIPSGVIKGDRIEQYFHSLWGNQSVRDTNIPIAITAVDLNTAETIFFMTPLRSDAKILNAKYYYNIQLVDAVRASISIPGIFTPKDYLGMALVDGAVKNNLPADILREMGADVVISVDLGYDGQPNYSIQSVGEVLLQCIEIMSREVTLLKGRQHSDIVIRPQTFDISFANKGDINNCIERGAIAARELIPDILDFIGQSS
jgi:NTE family protein